MTPWVIRLIVANVVVFFLEASVPGVKGWGELVPALMLVRPWTLVTYMFLHAGAGHILFNMLGLYFFGPRLEVRLGGSRFLALYFTSGIAARQERSSAFSTVMPGSGHATASTCGACSRSKRGCSSSS